ncbi:multifunctional 2',3'-cyclic-nucleotide 2'-phosphodiesterase/5'-nucleotidase/3'-nucleotidase [Bifidobacterium lemurum]|uniref:Multifunctional 2',3'-cyclic-nucleotide 2'-phosphodiesterase/5'-nucleotidase/3'-nucleotidase n=1 Tax=Bifidobacterium lemurum TaxID=1603886 RepID=A0A261FT37_9BIFI|nr:5'-nucleotidase C-terminal domain-containing protein [Bifidobacterium lemurum]OZG62319.1 multifunctional 2',3'-cyclic-nucleotide 2'-phosphodiesterase/5'-nucleotidase/3'-nucleotidase [Bifidobacterium lemurum]
MRLTMCRKFVAMATAALTIGAMSLTVGAAMADEGANPSVTAGDTTTVTIFGLSDFHGHIENGGYLATALKQTQAKNPNTIFAAAGDMVGASAFASSIANDEPAMEQLTAMNMVVSATGNHEYDQGAADLVDRIMPGMSSAQYIVANVSGGALEGKIQPYTIVESGGKSIAFIGGVYETLLDSVSPAGMAGVTVSDPVEAINSYADQLSDGDESNGEADAVVALVHADAHQLTGLNANVDAVVAGHTHLDQETQTASGAPIEQTRNYGESYATIDLEITGSGKDAQVSASGRLNDVIDKKSGEALYAADPDVNAIYERAQAAADEQGNTVLGTIDTGSTFNRGRAVTGDLASEENRGVESTLGVLNADAAMWAANEHGQQADIGVINAGGLRADLDPNGDKIITLKEAHDVLPFGNSTAVVTLTGAQLKALLEQQWQPAGASRPVQWLGLSSNVSYHYNLYTETINGTTLPRGEVFDLTVNGEAVQDEDTFTIAGNPFLLTGGDNFTVFKEGTNYVDTGYIDFDGLSDYLQAHPNLKAVSTRGSTGFSAVDVDGNTVSFTVSGLAFTTDEQRPKSIKLTANGVDFGTLKILDFSGEVQGPGAGSVTVTKTLSDAELETFLDGTAAVADSATSTDTATIRTAEVEVLFTDAETEDNTGAPETQPTLPDTGSATSAIAAVAVLLLAGGVMLKRRSVVYSSADAE